MNLSLCLQDMTIEMGKTQKQSGVHCIVEALLCVNCVFCPVKLRAVFKKW